MKPVIQEEKTGCAIASAAAIAGVTYKEAKVIANKLGIFAEDTALWSETNSMRKLLANFGVTTGDKEIPFENWDALPDNALLSIKWHLEKGKAYWHWVAFTREKNCMVVLDSNNNLKKHIRTDFGRIKPKWYIAINCIEVFTRGN